MEFYAYDHDSTRVSCLIVNRQKEDGEMSQHPSLKSASRIRLKRNVLKRFERVDVLKERGEWKDGDRGLGLKKTKSS